MNNYKAYKTIAWAAVALLAITAGCKKNEIKDDHRIDDTYQPVRLTPMSGTRIAWDYHSLIQLSAKGMSPKMIRLSDLTLAAVYEADGGIFYIQSSDDGQSWSPPIVLFPKSSHPGKDGDYDITYTDLMTQPTITQLQNGDLLAACAVRYNYVLTDLDPAVEIDYPASILARRITGGGTNLEPIQVVYSNLGCNEPGLLVLPDGGIQLYFTNGATSQSLQRISSTELDATITESRIDMIHSDDEGLTWSSNITGFGPDGQERRWTGAKTIVYRAGKHNNRPAAEIVGEEIVVSFSDNKTVTYKPFTVRTPLANIWPYAINGDTPERDYAFYEIFPDNYFMAAPYLLTLPSGETLLAYETDVGRMNKAETMEVAVGDKAARNFTKATRPFPFPADRTAVDNSLALFDDQTVAALTSSNYGHQDGGISPWMMKGYLIDDLTVTDATMAEPPIFVGGLSASHIRVGLGTDASNLYFRIATVDQTPVSAAKGTEIGDGVYLYIDAPNLSLRDVDTGISKFWVSSEGDIVRWDGYEGQWVQASAEGIGVTSSRSDDGYSLDVVIPTSKLVDFNAEAIRFATGFTDYTDEENGTTELLSLCEDLRSSSWLQISF